MAEKEKPQKELTIKLHIENGSIVAHPNPGSVKPGGKLDWDVEDSRDLWTVEFAAVKPGGSSSDDKGPYHDGAKKRHRHDGHSHGVRHANEAMHFHYTVAVYHAEDNQVYLVDPEVIVDPGED